MNNKILVSIDFDNSIYDGFAIADLLYDYAKKMRKRLFLYYPIVKVIQSSIEVIGKIFEERTGETTLLKILNHFIFKKHPIPYSFLDEEAKKIADKIPKSLVDKINEMQESGIEVVVNTAEPVEYVSKILDYAGVECEVLGNSLDVREGKVYGFKNPLIAGISGKIMRLQLYTKGRRYKEVISLGDSKSDSINDPDPTYKSIKIDGNLEEVIESITREKILN